MGVRLDVRRKRNKKANYNRLQEDETAQGRVCKIGSNEKVRYS